MTNLEHLNMAEAGAGGEAVPMTMSPCAASPGPNNPMHDPRRAW